MPESNRYKLIGFATCVLLSFMGMMGLRANPFVGKAFFDANHHAVFLPKKALGQPAKYNLPVNSYDIEKTEDRFPLPWIVYSDRDNNRTYFTYKQKTPYRRLFFMEKYIVVEEKNEYVHIVKDPNISRLTLSDYAIDYGWIHKKNLLLWRRCLVTRRMHNDWKVLIAPDIDPVLMKFKKNPQNHSVNSGIKVNPSEIYFVYKLVDIDEDGHSDYMLLATHPRLPSDENLLRKKIVVGWASKEKFTFWNQRLALEPNWENKARMERKYGQKARLFRDMKTAQRYAENRWVPKTKIVWDDDPIGGRVSGQWMRMPIIRELGKNFVLVSSHFLRKTSWPQPAFLGIAPLKVKGQTEPLFKKVLLLSRRELGQVVENMFKLAHKDEEKSLRENLVDNWKRLISKQEERYSDDQMGNIPVVELNRLIFGVPSSKEFLRNLRLKHLLDQDKITNQNIELYFNMIEKNALELEKIFNTDNDYPYSFRSNGIRYFWISIDYLP